MIAHNYLDNIPIECINRAAVTYYVPATVIISVLKTEEGWVGLAKLNKNGTIDYGPMQINTLWLKKIASYGYNQQQIQYDPCVNVMVGTWILSREIATAQNYWRGVANYHSHTLTFNQIYQQKTWQQYSKLQQALGQ